MANRLSLTLFVILILSITVEAQDESAREVFKRTRKPEAKQEPLPKNDGPTTATKIKKPSSTASNNSAPNQRKKKVTISSNPSGYVTKNKAPNTDKEDRKQTAVIDNNNDVNMGLGYTLFLDNGPGGLSSISPSRVFRTGQGVRLLLESNIDGYLYIFHQENDGQPKMLFPSWQDNGGNNYIQAHKLVFVPSENKITFTGAPATETLTVVVSREPIQGLPLGKDLNGAGRIIIPARLFQQLTLPCSCLEDRDEAEGQQREGIRGARDIELTKSDPLPAYIYLNRNRNTDRLATRIKLIHQ